MPQQDPLRAILDPAKLPGPVKAQLWDAFTQATDANDLSARMDRMSIPTTIKADLWDLKSKGAVPAGDLGAAFTANGKPVVEETPSRRAAMQSWNQAGEAVKELGAGFGETVWGGVAPFVPTTKESGEMGRQMASGEFFLHLAQSALSLSPEHRAEAQKMVEASKAGDYATASRHALGLLPLFGPYLSAQGDLAASGHPWKAAGNVLGMGATVLGPSKLPRRLNLPAVARNPNATMAAAVDSELRAGVPVDVGTATGNTLLKGAGQAAERMTISGSIVGRRAAQTEAEALNARGAQLASRANPNPAVPASAGEATRVGVEDAIHQIKVNVEDPAYAVFHRAAKNPANTVSVQVGSKQVPTGVLNASGAPVTRTVPVTEQIAMPVDVTAIRAEAAPVFNAMKKWWEPARRNASQAYTALESILKGRDVISAEEAEAALGGLKSLAREAASADLRNVNQGTAAGIVPKLQKAIDNAAAKAGPDVLQGLREGRAAHATKMEAADVLKQLRDEPVQTFGQMTWAGDAGIERLRAVSKLAPNAMPKVGRAYLDKLLTLAEREGAFSRADRLFNEWNNLGPQTKRILFRDPSLIQDLDNFFLVGKKMGESMNPSGSAHVGGMVAHLTNMYTFRSLGTGISLEIGGAGLAKLLRSPGAAKILTRGLTVPISDGARASLVTSQILRLAKESGVPVVTRREGRE